MTSKSSLVNQIRHNCMKRLWCMAIVALGFFTTLPLFIAGRSSQLKNLFLTTTNEGKRVLEGFYLYDAFTPNGNKYSSWMIIIAAVLLGITSFSYLNNKSHVDLYHSMPNSRMKLFFVRYLSGYVLFVLPYLLNLGIAGMIAIVQKQMVLEGWFNVFRMFLFQNILFLAIYTEVCLAVIITGTLLNNVLMTLGVLLIEILVDYVLDTLRSLFFITYVPYGHNHMIITPVHYLFEAINEEKFKHNSDIYSDFFMESCGVWKILFGILVILILAIVLFHKRASEKAGKAIIFSKVELFIKMIITTLSTFICASLGQSMFTVDSFGWYIFGGVAGFVLSHILIEILFRGDFRAAFSHIWHWGIDFVAVALVFVAFRYDIFGYDTYLPKKGDIQSVAVSFAGLDDQIEYSNFMSTGADYAMEYYNYELYRLQYMEITDFEKVLELSNIGIVSEKKGNPWEKTSYLEPEMGIYTDLYALDKEGYIKALKNCLEDTDSWSYSQRLITYTVKYTLKNGNEIYRTYNIDITDELVRELMGSIYDQPGFKSAEYPILHSIGPEGTLKAICLSTPFFMVDKKLNMEDGQRFLEIYQEELSQLSFEEIMSNDGIGQFEFDLIYQNDMSNSSEYRYVLSGYPLYPSFTKTIACLEEMGINVNIDLDEYSIQSLKVSTSALYYEYEDDYCYYPTVEYTDADLLKIQEIIDTCDWRYNTHSFTKDNILLDVEVEYYNYETGESYWNYGQFKAEEIPDFVLEDMMDELEKINIE